VDRLKRITDLFVEGRELNLGDDETGTPVLVWINKLNSFEDEDARRDGMAARTERILSLTDDNPEMRMLRDQMLTWDNEKLSDYTGQQHYDEDYMLAMDDIDAEEEWTDRLEYLRRGPTLHDDADLPEDDPRRQDFEKVQAEYFTHMGELAKKRQAERAKDYAKLSRTELEEKYIEMTKNRMAMEVFLEERRVTELYFAARDCQGTRVGPNEFEHSKCDHRKRLLADRKEVRMLPSDAITKMVNLLGDVTVERRAAGNSGALVTSSESLEQPNQQEASAPSTPEVTAPVVGRT
jgi:hypothetical protein